MQHSTGKDVAIQSVGYAPLRDGVIVNGELRDPAALTATLREMWRAHKFKSKQVAFSLGTPQVITRSVAGQEWLPEKEFAQSLRYIVSDFVPEIDDFTFDYHVTAETDEPTGREDQTRRMRRLIVVASPKEAVNTFVEAIREAGLMPVRADLAPFSLIRACMSSAAAPGGSEAIVDIGANLTTVIVHSGGQPQFVRIIPNGSDAITKALVKKFLWSTEDAETTKRQLGLSSGLMPSAPTAVEPSIFSTEPQAPAEAFQQEHPAQEVINQISNATISEIRMSLDFFLNGTDTPTTITRVVLTGGGSLLKGLPQRLASELRTTVEYAAPLHLPGFAGKVAAPDGTAEPQWTVVTGTALGEKR